MGKSQITGHVFIYIFTAVLIGVVFIYGFNAVNNFRQRAEQLSFLKFQNDLRNAVKEIYSDYGTEKLKAFDVPNKFSETCFMATYPDFPTPLTSSDTIDPIVQDIVNSKVQKNIFLRNKEGITTESFFIEEKIRIMDGTNNFFCIKSLNGKLKIKLIGKGDHAEIVKI